MREDLFTTSRTVEMGAESVVRFEPSLAFLAYRLGLVKGQSGHLAKEPNQRCHHQCHHGHHVLFRPRRGVQAHLLGQIGAPSCETVLGSGAAAFGAFDGSIEQFLGQGGSDWNISELTIGCSRESVK